MTTFPKLKVRKAWNQEESTVATEEARSLLFEHGLDMMVIVEGQVIYSYEELIRIVSQDCYQGKEFLDVVMVPNWSAGG